MKGKDAERVTERRILRPHGRQKKINKNAWKGKEKE